MSRALPPEPPSSEITSEELYYGRRAALKRSLAFATTAIGWGGALSLLSGRGQADAPARPAPPTGGAAWAEVRRGAPVPGEDTTPFEAITTYNNYYELGLSKSQPARFGHLIKPRPWTLAVEGEVHTPRVIDLDTLIGWFGLEERVYRMRCVEAWSMVVPWVGFGLGDLIRRLDPTSNARFVELTTLFDPEQLPGQESSVLAWPYVEALCMDEALHPLTLLAVGLYGSPLLGQNGAPVRLVVPWKYGFKGVKSIVKLRFTAQQPRTTWNHAAPDEYGFYANVNPDVDHPRWSQATERRIGELERRKTLPFNGYADAVAGLYTGLDLTRAF